ncbi:thioredoxin family protein [Flavobacterium sp.]|uniref:thioredoxin family protein n=1 Tax=Flavobacterium sp. TaxID=239 RepID=UPI002639083C|nr:thioredoxin family protein [Flavobacterium sp.]MDG2431491.1 thioredoxin family protein [Flavobacterium sp.]
MLMVHSQSTSSAKQEGNSIWYTDVKEAMVVSATKNKPLLLFFTGSDWCGWCIKLQTEVLKTPEFKKWAAENVVLVELDFPRKNLQTPEMQNQNAQIMQAFGVQGFPTIHIAKAVQKEGQVNFQGLGSTGYVPGGPTAFLEVTDGIIHTKQ